MKKSIFQKTKSWLSFLLAVMMAITIIPISSITAHAFSTNAGQTVSTEYGDIYTGYDGEKYYVGENHYALRYKSDGSTYIEASQIGTTRRKLMIVQNGEKRQALCIEYGVDIIRGTNTYVSENGNNSAFFNMLPMVAKRGILLTSIYGWHPGKSLPISGINEDDYALATQEIIWEYQQGIRTNPTSRKANRNIRADQFYDEIKGRPAEKAYNWILEQMASHATVPSFSSSDRDSSPVHTLKYDSIKGEYSVTLTDTNNTGVDISILNSKGITVSRNGNKYTISTINEINSQILLECKKDITLYGEPFLVWGNVGYQSMMTGVSDPIRFYLSVDTEANGSSRIIKTSEDGKISGISFRITGNGVDQTVTTNPNGYANIDLLPGTYSVTELTDNIYEPQSAKNIVIKSGETTSVTFNNVLKKGSLKITKSSEDGMNEGIKFRLYGTSDSGITVDKYAITDTNGIAVFEDIPIGNGYTVEEIDSEDKYIVPSAQTVAIEWNEVTEKTFYNELKKGNIKIIKTAEDGNVCGITFTVLGNGITETVVTDVNGEIVIKDLLPGTYTVSESSSDLYSPQEVQTVTVKHTETAIVTFNNTLRRGNLKIIKTSEDGLVSGIKFKLSGLSLLGHTVEEYATTNADGIAMFENILIGENYIVEEIDTPDKYVKPDSQTAIIEWNQTTGATFHNKLKYGKLKVTKTSEDHFNEGHKFHLYGTSLSGIPVDMYATTDENGVAHFEDVLIGTGYTIEEVDTAIRYVVPESQTVDIEWNKVTSKSFENILKKWRADIFKLDSDLANRNSEESGGVAPVMFELVSDSMVDDLGNPYGTSQGDATLEGAVYGVYKDDVLVDTYITDKNGYFITDYYPCYENVEWTIREISPSEGYLLDPTVYYPDTYAGSYTAELNTLYIDAYEDVIKGSISIIKHNDDGSTKVETPEVGAEFKVYLTSAGRYEEAHETERDHLICDENGYAETQKLPYGTYTVEQINGWDGREMMKPFTVTITEDGKIYRYIINNSVFESYIKIVKVDAETGNAIPYAGAGFKLYKPDGTPITQTFTYPEVTVVDTFYTNDKGYLITPERLEYGTGYHLVEVNAPYGYILNSDPVYFDITSDCIADENGITVVEVIKPNMAQKGIIKLYKTGEIFASVSEIDGIYQPVYSVKGLSGAEYEIRATEDIITPDGTTRYTAGEVVDTLTTDENGYAESKALYLGKYEIKEIKAPHGMVLRDEVHTVELIYAGQKIEITGTSAELWNDRQKITVMLDKLMEQNDIFGIGQNGEITSVVFGLYAAENLTAADGTVIPTDGLIEVMTVNENGTVVCNSNLPFGSYYLKEITTDEHYILNETKYSFTFEYAGQDIVVVELKANDGTPIENKLIYGEIHGIKKDDGGNAVSGALIGLFRVDSTEFTESTAILTTTSAEDGSFSFVSVPYGKWIVREIKAPSGYILAEESYPVTVNYHGEVIEVEIVNERIRGTVQLTKVDANYPYNKLTGAEFEVYYDTNGNKLLDEADELIGIMIEVEIGVYKLSDLLYGSYFVKETVAPEGFYLDSKAYYFEIIENGEIVTVENEAGIGFINISQTGSIKITKTSSDGNVAGFSFRITGPNGYDEVFVTDENGEIIIEGLRLGEYNISEVRNEISAKYSIPADKMATVFADSVTIVEMYNVLYDSPQTGDGADLSYWLMILCISGVGAVVCIVLEIRARKKDGRYK